MLHNIYSQLKYPLTDKNTKHCYIDKIYNKFDTNNYYLNIKNVLEIGISKGDSIRLWHDYFINATIYGIDIKKKTTISSDRINLIIGNAYDSKILNTLPNNFDLIIDDGPHTLDSMIYIVTNYINKLNDNGYIIIEDIPRKSWFQNLEDAIVDKSTLEIIKYDLRSVKNRFDDMVFIIKKGIGQNLFTEIEHE